MGAGDRTLGSVPAKEDALSPEVHTPSPYSVASLGKQDTITLPTESLDIFLSLHKSTLFLKHPDYLF